MFRFRVELEDGRTFELEGRPRDVVRWEAIPQADRRQPPRYLGQLEKAPTQTALTELAWCAATRLGLYDQDMKSWLRDADVSGLPAEEVEDDEAGGLDPFPPGH